jgi:hypothetical protein
MRGYGQNFNLENDMRNTERKIAEAIKIIFDLEENVIKWANNLREADKSIHLGYFDSILVESNGLSVRWDAFSAVFEPQHLINEEAFTQHLVYAYREEARRIDERREKKNKNVKQILTKEEVIQRLDDALAIIREYEAERTGQVLARKLNEFERPQTEEDIRGCGQE